MTRPVSEDSWGRVVAHTRFRTDQTERRPPPVGRFLAKLFQDDEPVVAGDNAAQLILKIPADLDGTYLRSAEAGLTTVGGSVTHIQVRNATQAHDMLSTRITIASGDEDSSGSSPPVINPANALVAAGDKIAFDIDDAGSGSMGLSVAVGFA